MAAKRDRDVFINRPFDRDYQVLFQSIVFVVIRSGFRPRRALEADDASQNRLEKIFDITFDITAGCRYGVHDISRTDLDPESRLPRFNMPLELGLFLAAKKFGPGLGSKRCIVFDTKQYRYQKFISDIAGQDIHAHGDDREILIGKLAAWLRDQSGDVKVPGKKQIGEEFSRFVSDLPEICAHRSLAPEELTLRDMIGSMAEYIAARR